MILKNIERLVANRLYKTGKCMIHVGKCGGSSVKGAMQHAGIADQYTIAHTYPVAYSKDIDYYIQLRHPIKRLISAYNWRHTRLLVDGDQHGKFHGELEALKLYPSLEELACDLYDGDHKNIRVHNAFNKIRHVKEGIHHHLKRIIRHDDFSTQIQGVFHQENLDEDVRHILGVEIVKKRNVNNRAVVTTELSTKAYDNLKKFAENDLKTIKKLYDHKLISDKMYDYYIT